MAMNIPWAVLVWGACRCAKAGPSSIHLRGLRQDSGVSVAELYVESRSPRHRVHLVGNGNTKEPSKWKSRDSFSFAGTGYAYRMPGSLERKKFYAFKLVEGGSAYFTKPMYYSRDRVWLEEWEGLLEMNGAAGVAPGMELAALAWVVLMVLWM